MTIDEVTETLKECERELRIALSHMTALTDQPELRKAIALADGILPGGERYLTKYQMITLCKRWLEQTNVRRGSVGPVRSLRKRRPHSPQQRSSSQPGRHGSGSGRGG